MPSSGFAISTRLRANCAATGWGGVVALLLAWSFAAQQPASAASLPASSAGCGRAALTGAQTASTEDGNGTSRLYRFLVPAGYSPARAYPVVFVFHAAGGSAEDSIGWGLQDAPGAAANAIFVFPKGIDFQHQGPGWDDTSGGYDFPFFDHMLEQIESGYCVDPQRVFVTGFSWGGDFAVALACNRGDVIRAVAAYSTSDEFEDPADFHSYRDLPCPARHHPAIRFAHARGGDAKYPAPYFATTSKLLRYLNGCSSASDPAQRRDAAMCRAYRGCASRVVECAFDPAIGHALPPHWAADTWAFFQEFAR